MARNDDRTYGSGTDAGYRGSGHLGGDWKGGRDPVSHRGRGPRNYQRPDARIREDVCELLMADDDIDATEIDVVANEAIVTLRGTVADRATKRHAEDVAASVFGVADVQNELRLSR